MHKWMKHNIDSRIEKYSYPVLFYCINDTIMCKGDNVMKEKQIKDENDCLMPNEYNKYEDTDLDNEIPSIAMCESSQLRLSNNHRINDFFDIVTSYSTSNT